MEVACSRAAPPEPERSVDDEVAADEKVMVDCGTERRLHSTDSKSTRGTDRNRSYRAVYNIADKKFVQLADDSMEGLSPSNDGVCDWLRQLEVLG